ncbi:sialate O-acetylesterase [Saccharicrinis fermentans]|uniref:Sialate O-acetylesterase domain-containing protein n=1 Tax=Saccharicrinis fermentans DSM 9555 = JCM 21142 TaxID=869213 RepID=W7Y3J6_9BACT|nr:sialate O-acetylesterase [Saccharicrinis fermentans]GAF02143.1 hypothetical protein JCM21142_2770 [Saccharicrinis fermentans DSM 9555 = JCM 21142]
MKRKILYLIVVISIISLNSIAQNVVHVVLLGGQSNMAGAGNYYQLDSTLRERIEVASQRVELSVDGLPPRPLSYTYSTFQKRKRGFGAVFGPELLLGVTLAEAYPKQEFLFIKLAQGGTSLYGAWNPEWSRDKALELERGEMKQNLQLFKKHVDIIHEQLLHLKNNGRLYRILGMVWMQGENDAAREVSARSYQTNLNKLIEAYRKEFKIPDMPFVMGQINSNYGRFAQGPQMVREAMVNVAQSDVHVGIITTVPKSPWLDYPKHTDNVHYNTEGQRRLGIAFAKILIDLSCKMED